MKLEVFYLLDDDLSGHPYETFEDIDGFLPLGETLLQVDVSEKETVLISGFRQVRVTRTDEEVAEMKQAMEDFTKKQHLADLSNKYLSL